MTDQNLHKGPSGDPAYALQKFTQAVEHLATCPAAFPWRLKQAFLCVVSVTPQDLPEHLRSELTWIRHTLTQKEPYHKPKREHWGKLEATLYRMRGTTATRIATRFVELEGRLRSYVDECCGNASAL